MIRSNEKKRNEIKISDISIVPCPNEINRDRAKFIAAMLYGCEGSKYPATSGISFANSDPYLIVTFISLLRKSFDLDESKFYIHLQVHSTHDYLEIRKFWSDILNISEKRFIKPTTRIPRGGKHRKNYMGTCTVRYEDYRIQLSLLGIYESFIKQFYIPEV